MQQYSVYLYLQTALHVSGGISTHHQELILLYLQYLASGNLSWAWRSRLVAVKVSVMPDTVDTVMWAPDDGWRSHPKHVGQSADVNNCILLLLMCIGPCIVVITEEWNQLVATSCFIILMIGSTCFGHYYAHHQELTTIVLTTILAVPFCKDG